MSHRMSPHDSFAFYLRALRHLNVHPTAILNVWKAYEKCNPSIVRSLMVWQQLLFASHPSPRQVYSVLETMISLGTKPSTSCFLLGLFTAFKSNNEYQMSRIFKEMFVHGKVCDHATYLLFQMYVRNHSFVDAKELLVYVSQAIKNIDLVPYYNLAIEWLSRAGFGDEAKSFYEKFQRMKLRPNDDTHWALFALWCRSAKNVSDLVHWAKERRISGDLSAGVKYFDILLTELWRRRKVHHAIELFREMISGNVRISSSAFVVMGKILCYKKDEEKLEGLLLLMRHYKSEPRLGIYNEMFFLYANKPDGEEKFMRLFDHIRARGLLPDIDTISNLVLLKSKSSIEEAKQILEYYGLDNPLQAFVIANQGTTRLRPHGATDRILNLLLKIYISTQEYSKAWEVYNTLKQYRNKNTYIWLIKLYAATGKLGDVTSLFDEMTSNSLKLHNIHYQQLLEALVNSGEIATALTLYSKIKAETEDDRLARAFRSLVEQAGEENMQSLFKVLKNSKDPQDTMEDLTFLFCYLEGDLRLLLRLFRRMGLTLSAKLSKMMIEASLRREDLALAAEINDRRLFSENKR